jgi:hypothetical protein
MLVNMAMRVERSIDPLRLYALPHICMSSKLESYSLLSSSDDIIRELVLSVAIFCLLSGSGSSTFIVKCKYHLLYSYYDRCRHVLDNLWA